MKIIRFAACAAVAAAFGTGVAAPQTQSNPIVGAWTCAAITPESVIAGTMTYNADGTMDANISVEVEFDDGLLKLQVVTKSSWKMLDDGLIEEVILTAEAVSGTANGNPLEADDLALFGESVPNEAGQSTVEVTEKQLVLVDGEGVRTQCAR